MGQPPGLPPLPYRTRPPQVLLGVGAVLVVAAGAAALAAPGDPVTRGALLLLAALGVTFSVASARAGLRASRETLAACAVGLAAAGSGALSTPGLPGAAAAAALTGIFSALRRTSPATATWLLAAWGAGQVVVLRLLPQVPTAARPEAVLAVAGTGLLLALGPGRSVPRALLVTALPWAVVGVATGVHAAWTAGVLQRWPVVPLVAVAATGLLAARLRPALDPLLGPPGVVPGAAGLVTGAALTGALAGWGPAGCVVAGYAGVLVAATVRELLGGWRRGLLGPVAVAGGAAMAALALVDLALAAHWAALALLLLLTAVPAGVVAALRPGERAAAVPTALGCLAGATVLAVPARVLTADAAAAVLTGLMVLALLAAAGLPAGRRRGAGGTATGCAVAAVGLAVVGGGSTVVDVLLAVQGVLTLTWAAVAGRRPVPVPAAWRAGAAELVVACWLAAAGAPVLEAYSLPLAGGLLLAAGPRLATGPSWPAWGPGLLVAAVPSAVLAVVGSGSTRPVLVLVAAAVVLVAAARVGVRAPLLVAAGTAVGVALGLAVVALPWPVAAALATGIVLLAVGARRERFPVAAFGARLADLR